MMLDPDKLASGVGERTDDLVELSLHRGGHIVDVRPMLEAP
jgi:hypothetical protein